MRTLTNSYSLGVVLLLFLCINGIGQATSEGDFLGQGLRGRGITSVNQLTAYDQNAIVTIIFKEQISPDENEELRKLILSAMISRFQGLKNPKENYDVIVVDQETSSVDPHQISLLVRTGGRPQSAIVTASAIGEYKETIIDRFGLHLVSVSGVDVSRPRHRLPRADPDPGAPQPTEAEGAGGGEAKEKQGTASSSSSSSVWDAHRPLFIAIIIFLCVTLVLTIICCICFRCRRRASRAKSADTKEEPKVVLSPSGPMKEQWQPNEPPPIDEENGWIIPLDQMTKEELDQPEVQVSRL